MIELNELSKIYYNYALKFLEENCLSQGIEYLKRSIMLNKENVEALNLIGICEYKNCNFEKSYYFWNKSFEYIKENNRANKYLIDLKSEEFKEFIIFYNKGIENIELGNYKEAIKIFENVLKTNNEFIEPYILISIANYHLKKYDISKFFLEKVILFDKFNDKYLKLLKEIDSKSISTYRNWIIKKKKLIGVLGTVASISLFSSLVNYNDKLKQEEKLLSYEKNISKIEENLINVVKEKNVLNTELQGYKVIESNFNLKDEQKEFFIDEIDYKNNDEGEVFLEAVSLFKKEKYEKALKGFMYISEKGEQTTLVGESIFFLAVCAEKISDVFLASKYYIKYITDFKNCNYYDDALYNYGLMKYKLGDIELAKKVLNKLYKEVPDSIFLNSNVKYILK